MKRKPNLSKKYVFDRETNKTIASMKLINPVMFEVQACCSRDTLDSVIGLIESGTKEFIGTSKPDEEDTYNEMYGNDIAAMKADLKYHMYMTKKYVSLCEKLQKAIKELAVLADNHYKKVQNITEDMNNRYL